MLSRRAVRWKGVYLRGWSTGFELLSETSLSGNFRLSQRHKLHPSLRSRARNVQRSPREHLGRVGMNLMGLT